MRYSNKHNIPEAVFNAVINDPYSKGDADYSVTQLLAPARLKQLEMKYDHEIEVDVMDRIWSLLGQSMHVLLERAESSSIKEQRLSMNILNLKVSGGMDSYHLGNGALQDYKLTNAKKIESALTYGSTDWTAQLNIYAEILRCNGYNPKKLEIVAIARDFNERDSYDPKRPKYPKQLLTTIPIDMWPQGQARSFIESRIKAHESAKITLPRCDESETWNGIRCRKWCTVSNFCSQYLEKQ